MAILFKNPILRRLEDILWEKAKLRYVEEGGDPINDLKKVSREVKHHLKGWVDAWQFEERKKIDLAWPEFRRIVTNKTDDSLYRMLNSSHSEWYSVEVKDNIYPVILAVPYDVLYYWTEKLLPIVLAEKIQFKDMMKESLQSLSSYAMNMFFATVIYNASKKYKEFVIRDAHRPAIIVDVLGRDYYHLGTNEKASIVKMVIISTFDGRFTNKDKKKISQAKKEAAQYWKKIKIERNGKSGGRRFTGNGWNLPEDFLINIAIE